MGTNFFCIEKISRRQRSKIKSLLREYIGLVDKADTACDFHELHSKYNEMILDIIPEKVHLGKRSHGWQFLWNYHDGRYFKANLESIKEYLKDKIIVDEYGEVFSLDQFLDDEIGHCLYNADGKLEDGMKGYSRYTFISDDGLRFSKSEDFS